MEYTFTLKFRLASVDADSAAVVERLAAEGCDDALVGLGQPGRVAMEFVRDAADAKQAMMSALADVQRALPTATLIEASPDLVGITDVAEITGVTRQNIRKLMISHSDSAPLPVHAGNPSLWHLTDVLTWLGQQVGYAYPAHTFEIARVAEQVNISKEVTRLTSAGEGALPHTG